MFSSILTNYVSLQQEAKKFITDTVKERGDIEFDSEAAEEAGQVIPMIIYTDDFPEPYTPTKLILVDDEFSQQETVNIEASGDNENSDYTFSLEDLTVDELIAVCEYINEVILKDEQ